MWRRSTIAAVVLASVLVLASAAEARNAYVANAGDGTVTVVDAANHAVLGAVPVGGEPVDVAVTPDAGRAFVVDRKGNAVRIVDTATNAVVGSVAVGSEPRGIAITPGGGIAFVSNSGDDTVSVFATANGVALRAPIPVGPEPDGVAITPDGATAFVARRGGGIAAISVPALAVVGAVADPRGPSRLALGPRGGRAFVTDSAAATVTAFNPANLATIGLPIPVGSEPAGIAIEPSGTTAYVASPADGTVMPLNTSLNLPSGGSLPFPGATGIAIRPDGLAGYVTDVGGAAVTILDTRGNAPAGRIPAGSEPVAVAFAPNQGPRASFWASPIVRRAKKAVTFHGSGSVDVDGRVVEYAWDFGDGHKVSGPQTTRTHRYRRAGTYFPTLTVTDNEGCSTAAVSTGQTLSCNGGPAAVSVVQLDVRPERGPVLRAKAVMRQRLRGVVKLRARCPQVACGLRAEATAIAVVGEGNRKQRRFYRVRPAKRPAMSRGWRVMSVRLPARTRKRLNAALRQGGTAVVRATAIGRDAIGDETAQELKITLRR